MSPSTTSRNAKDRVLEVLARQSDDIGVDDLLREIAFRRLVDRGLHELDTGHTVDTEDLVKRIRAWTG